MEQWHGSSDLTKEASKFSLITNVLDISHLRILKDWIEFFDWPPEEIVTFIGSGEEIEQAVRSFCEDEALKLSVVGVSNPLDMKENEPQYLRTSFEAVQNEFAVLVHLDTLPYRAEGTVWFEPALKQMESNNAIFVTGSTRLYETDKPTDDPDFFLTQRLSNNFLIISPNKWLSIQNSRSQFLKDFGRFSSEAAIESYCHDQGVFGVRVRNSLKLRVLHTQEWGPRMTEVRRKMHNAESVQFFLEGWEEDFKLPWDRFYCFPRPSRIQLITREIRSRVAIRTRLRDLMGRKR